MADMVNAFWQVLNMPFIIMNMSYTLLDVIYCTLLLGCIGLFIGKIIFFALGDR